MHSYGFECISADNVTTAGSTFDFDRVTTSEPGTLPLDLTWHQQMATMFHFNSYLVHSQKAISVRQINTTNKFPINKTVR